MSASRDEAERPATDSDAIAAAYEPHHMAFCRSEFERLFVPDSDLRRLIEQARIDYVPDGSAALPLLLDLVAERLRDGRPLSMLRVGNGEGNTVSMAPGNPTETQARAFYNEFVSQNGIAAPLADVIPLCREVRSALVNADILGFRSVRTFVLNERELIVAAIERDDAYEALGLLYARNFLREGLEFGFLREKTITNAWLHLDLFPALDRLLELAESVVVITGRDALEDPFRARLGSRLRAFIGVPVQGVRPTSVGDSHLGAVYPQVRSWLKERDLAGTLVLVGAGLFGKVYIDDARKSGGVALDLGSAFDLLAGLRTRPVHKRFDVGGMTWIPVEGTSSNSS